MNPCSGSDIAIHKHVILAKSKMESSSIPCRSAVNMNKKMDKRTKVLTFVAANLNADRMLSDKKSWR